MFQTLFGSALLLFGLLLLIFNQRIAQFSINLDKWALGIGELVPGSKRAGVILSGLFCITFGLLYALHIITI